MSRQTYACIVVDRIVEFVGDTDLSSIELADDCGEDFGWPDDDEDDYAGDAFTLRGELYVDGGDRYVRDGESFDGKYPQMDLDALEVAGSLMETSS